MVSHPFPEIGNVEGAVNGILFHKLLTCIPSRKIALDVSEPLLKLYSAGERLEVSLKARIVSVATARDRRRARAVKSANGFSDNLWLAAAVCARDMSRPALTCVHVTDKMMEASDSYRAIRVFCDGLPKMLLPVTR